VRVSDMFMFGIGVDIIVHTWARSDSGDKARHERVSTSSQDWHGQAYLLYNSRSNRLVNCSIGILSVLTTYALYSSTICDILSHLSYRYWHILPISQVLQDNATVKSDADQSLQKVV
jgi:hypothetical protein